jgi:DNA-binding transcriptional LysR family regulator
MRRINLRSIDLNLLTALEALLEEKSVTKAGARLYLSQSAMSRALGRLRAIFDDQILVQCGRASVLTPKAESLQPELQQILGSIRKFVAAQEFEPSAAEGSMSISASDAMVASFLAEMIRKILFEAPQVHFSLNEPQSNDPELLRQGHLDLLLSARHPDSDLHSTELLIDNRLTCLVSKSHPLAGQKLTKANFLQHGHIELGTPTGKLIERRLKKKGYDRRLALKASSLISAAAIAAQTDWIFTVPTIFAISAVKMFDLAMLDMPLKLVDRGETPIALYMIWHERCNADPLNAWVRSLLVKQLKGWFYV